MGPRRSAPQGPISPATSAALGPREKGVDARGGPSREEITVISHPQPSQQRAAGCRGQATAAQSRSEKVRGLVSWDQVNSSPCRPAPPRPAPPLSPAPARGTPELCGPRPRPFAPPPTAERRPLVLTHVPSPLPLLSPRLLRAARSRRQDFRPLGSRKMAAAVGALWFLSFP